jgi:hypothetical protein
MESRNKILIFLGIILILVIIAVFYFKKNDSSTLGYANNISGTFGQSSTSSVDFNSKDTTLADTSPFATSTDDSSIETTPRPKDDSANSDIDTYLKAYRTSEQPNPDDFDDPYSDLK